MTNRLEIPKTYKLFIGGQFPRSESGRSLLVRGVHIAHASRKDLRSAVEAARVALPKWAGATPYNRGQVLYRMAEMLEGKRGEFSELLKESARGGKTTRGTQGARRARGSEDEVSLAIDRLICFAGWADKYAHVLGCNNPVAGPYYNFTVPEPTGVVGIIAPDRPALLGLVALLAPPLCAGNTVVVLAGEQNPLAGAVLGEVCATSDVPAGAVNILTGLREELVPHFASHREIDALHAAGITDAQAKLLREGIADNLKRVTVRDVQGAAKTRTAFDYSDEACSSPWWIEPFVEFKTIWHPSGT